MARHKYTVISPLLSLNLSHSLSLTLSRTCSIPLSLPPTWSLSNTHTHTHTHTRKGRAYDPARGRAAGRVEQEVDGGNGGNEAGAMIAWDVSDIHCEGRVNVGPQGYYLTGGRYARGGKELGQFTGEMQRAEMWGKQDPRDPGGIVQLDGVTLEPTQMCGHINVYRVTEVKGRQTKKEKDGASGNTGPHAIVRSLTGSGSGGAPASCDIRRGDVLVKLNNVNVIGKPLEKLCFDAPLEAIFWQPSQNAGVWSVEILPIDSDEDPELPRNPRNSNNDIDAAACTSLETGLGRRTVVGAVEHEVVFSSYPMPLIDTQGGTVGGGASGAEGAAAVGSATSGATSTGGAAGGFVPVISMHPGFEATLNLGHTTPFAHPDMEEVRRWAVRESGGHLDDGGGGAGAGGDGAGGRRGWWRPRRWRRQRSCLGWPRAGSLRPGGLGRRRTSGGLAGGRDGRLPAGAADAGGAHAPADAGADGGHAAAAAGAPDAYARHDAAGPGGDARPALAGSGLRVPPGRREPGRGPRQARPRHAARRTALCG